MDLGPPYWREGGWYNVNSIKEVIDLAIKYKKNIMAIVMTSLL